MLNYAETKSSASITTPSAVKSLSPKKFWTRKATRAWLRRDEQDKSIFFFCTFSEGENNTRLFSLRQAILVEPAFACRLLLHDSCLGHFVSSHSSWSLDWKHAERVLSLFWVSDLGCLSHLRLQPLILGWLRKMQEIVALKWKHKWSGNWASHKPSLREAANCMCSGFLIHRWGTPSLPLWRGTRQSLKDDSYWCNTCSDFYCMFISLAFARLLHFSFCRRFCLMVSMRLKPCQVHSWALKMEMS